MKPGHRDEESWVMTTNTGLEPTPAPLSTSSTPAESTKPSFFRRAALIVTAFLAGLLPVVFALNLSRMLLTGELSEHRFHQATGQGLLLCALWLVPIIGMVRAGWRGRRPSTALGLQHLAFVTTGIICSAIAPGGGAPFLLGVIAVTGGLLWLALPLRPRLRTGIQIDPVLAPIALVGSALLLPYIVDQLAAQNATVSGLHAENPHFFDQAWMSACLIVLAIAAALFPAARHLVLWFAGSAIVVGAAGLLFGESILWSLLVLGVGVGAAVASLLARKSSAARIPA